MVQDEKNLSATKCSGSYNCRHFRVKWTWTNFKWCNFVPDNGINFGFEATLIFGNTGGGQTYNADVTFGAEFTSSGGINTMYLEGNVFFITEINDRSDVPIKGSARISYDFPRNIFSGTFSVTADFYDILSGNVTVNIYASPETWYIHVGTPT